MSRQLTPKNSYVVLIFSVLGAMLVAFSASAAKASSSKSYEMLLDLHNEQKSLLQSLSSKDLSNSQKLVAIKEQKQSTELTLKKLVIEGDGDPISELNNPLSPLSVAFKVGDLITVFSKLEVDGSDKFTAESCEISKGKLYITAKENNGIERLEKFQKKLEGLLNTLCAK